jgi:hypothetical protein
MRLQLQSQGVSTLISELEAARASEILDSILGQIENSGPTGHIVALYARFVNQPFVKSRFHAEYVLSITREALRPLRKPGIIFPGTLRKLQRVNRDTGEPSTDGTLPNWNPAASSCAQTRRFLPVTGG